MTHSEAVKKQSLPMSSVHTVCLTVCLTQVWLITDWMSRNWIFMIGALFQKAGVVKSLSLLTIKWRRLSDFHKERQSLLALTPHSSPYWVLKLSNAYLFPACQHKASIFLNLFINLSVFLAVMSAAWQALKESWTSLRYQLFALRAFMY